MPRWFILVLPLAAACGSPPDPPAPATVPAATQDSPAAGQPLAPRGRDALVAALAVRDPEPTCEALASLVEDPASELIAVVETVEMPPWVPMRAANCVLVHHGDVLGAKAVTWVSDPELEGLGILAINHLDDLPEPLAVEVAAAALDGPRADHVRRIVQHSDHAEVRALAPR